MSEFVKLPLKNKKLWTYFSELYEDKEDIVTGEPVCVFTSEAVKSAVEWALSILNKKKKMLTAMQLRRMLEGDKDVGSFAIIGGELSGLDFAERVIREAFADVMDDEG